MLAVDRNQCGACGAHLVHQQTPRHDERLLVREQHALARAHRRQRRHQPRGADDRGHHGIDAGLRDRRGERIHAGLHARREATGAQCLARFQCRGRLRENHRVRPESLRLFDDDFPTAPSSQRGYAITVGVPRDDIERAAADASRGSQYRDTAHVAHARWPMPKRPSAYNGAAAEMLSMRSKIPPWPGSSAPLSLSPAARLNMLSVKSPTIEKMTDRAAETYRARHRHAKAHGSGRGDRGDREHSADGALPGLARTDARRELEPAEVSAREERADVRAENQQQEPKHRLGTVNRAVTDLKTRERDERRHEHGNAAEQRQYRLMPGRREAEPQKCDDPPETGRAHQKLEPGRVAAEHPADPQQRCDQDRVSAARGGALQTAEARPFPPGEDIDEAEQYYRHCRRQQEQRDQQHTGEHQGRGYAQFKHRWEPPLGPKSCRSGARAAKKIRTRHRAAPSKTRATARR